MQLENDVVLASCMHASLMPIGDIMQLKLFAHACISDVTAAHLPVTS